VDAPIFDEALIAAHKICSSAVGPCHERDPKLPDRLDIHNVKSDLQTSNETKQHSSDLPARQ
jgi:hypothetical protein